MISQACCESPEKSTIQDKCPFVLVENCWKVHFWVLRLSRGTSHSLVRAILWVGTTFQNARTLKVEFLMDKCLLLRAPDLTPNTWRDCLRSRRNDFLYCFKKKDGQYSKVNFRKLWSFVYARNGVWERQREPMLMRSIPSTSNIRFLGFRLIKINKICL